MTETLKDFLDRVKAGERIEFEETLSWIARHYHYTPVRFMNGTGNDILVNEPGQNEASCKIFGMARLLGLTQSETLALFGKYFRDDVLGHPEGTDHRNIRNFMRYGWAGILFEGDALTPRIP